MVIQINSLKQITDSLKKKNENTEWELLKKIGFGTSYQDCVCKDQVSQTLSRGKVDIESTAHIRQWLGKLTHHSMRAKWQDSMKNTVLSQDSCSSEIIEDGCDVRSLTWEHRM